MAKDDLTPRENEVLALAWQCFESEPKVDTNKLASLTGYTPGSAVYSLAKIKRKLRNKTAGVGGNSLSTPKKTQSQPRTTASSGTKRTRNVDLASDDGNNNTNDSPSKHVKRNKSKKMEVDDEEEEFFTPPIKKEELDNINNGADNLYNQMHRAAVQYDATPDTE